MSDNASENKPNTRTSVQSHCDWRPQNCLPFLRSLNNELELEQPKMYRYIHNLYIVHTASGKKAIESTAVLPLVEEVDHTPQGLATPRRAKREAPLTPSAPPTERGTLETEQMKTYTIMPAIIEE